MQLFVIYSAFYNAFKNITLYKKIKRIFIHILNYSLNVKN